MVTKRRIGRKSINAKIRKQNKTKVRKTVKLTKSKRHNKKRKHKTKRRHQKGGSFCQGVNPAVVQHQAILAPFSGHSEGGGTPGGSSSHKLSPSVVLPYLFLYPVRCFASATRSRSAAVRLCIDESKDACVRARVCASVCVCVCGCA
jgi:hypothetical protein